MEIGASCLKVGCTTKTGLTGGHSRALYARVWCGVRGPFLPQEKNEFGDAMSRCLEGLEFETFCTVDHQNNSSPLSRHRHYFYANLDKLRDPYLS